MSIFDWRIGTGDPLFELFGAWIYGDLNLMDSDVLTVVAHHEATS